MWTDWTITGSVTLTQEFFNTYQRYFYFQYHQHSSQSRIFQNISFTLIGLQLKWFNFSKRISYKYRVWKCLEIDGHSMFSKKLSATFFYPLFKWINYNNVVSRKQLYFSPAFLKWWTHMSDNITGVVGDPQYY